jgi:hypothetical protein
MNVWHALESSRGLTAVAASWRERVGDQFNPFKTAFLQRAHGVAKGMPCPRGCACTHEIVQAESQSAFSDSRITHHASRSSAIRAVCRCEPPNCPDIPLMPDDILLFELSWTKISRALCHVFALDYKPVDLGLLNARQIGSWSVDAVPVILTIHHERAWFRTVLLELLARLRQRFILLAPTSKNFDAVSQELLASADAGFFALDANLTLSDQGELQLSSARVPGDLFARFTPQPKDVEEDVAGRAFALVQQLESQDNKHPTPLTIFRMYCIENLNVVQIARKCRCSRGTVRNRLELISARTGVKPDLLRRRSAHLEKIEAGLSDSRAAHIHRKNLIYDEDDSNEG